MAISIGDHLGHYEILGPLGSGGMGVVYRARDSRLDRLVALKILPPDKIGDPERKRRFIQEAKAASALNHPNIITIYEIGCEAGVDYMAMELVAGKALDELIPRQGMRVNELLRYSTQIADALAKAHSAGIVHRDLKPANVMATPEGLIKVLDFGLAKLTQAQSPTEAGDQGATQTAVPVTDEGTVMGTTPYMSPEQAEGLPVDGRSDIFSFGSMLYEMATGQRPFRGDTRMSVLSAILREDPTPAPQFREDLPPELVRIVVRCLRKDPARRFQNAADLKVSLDELKEESESGKLTLVPVRKTPAGSSRKWIAAVAGGVLLAMTAMAAGWYYLGRSAPTAVAPEFKPVPLTSYPGRQVAPSYSPDGRQVAFSWNGEKEDNFDIYVKVVGPGAPLRLTTDPATDLFTTWSPDGRNIAFTRSSSNDRFWVMVVPPLGGQERKIIQLFGRTLSSVEVGGLSWTPDSKFLVVAGSQTPGELERLLLVSAETGEARALTNPPAQSEDVLSDVSPDGHKLAFIRATGLNLTGLYVMTLGDGYTPRGEPRKLNTGDPQAYSPNWTADGGEIVFKSGAGTNGMLARIPASGVGPAKTLAWAGTMVNAPTLSRAGHGLIYAHQFLDTNIWRVDLGAKKPQPEKLIHSSFREVFPQYSPDGKRISFHSDRDGTVQIWLCNADGSQAVALTQMSGASSTGTARWSPDGQQLSFDSNAGGKWEIYTISADGGKPRQLTNDPSTNIIASWSKDGRWVYFGSNRTGGFQIWKVPSQGGDAVQVTRNGGTAALESPDGKWLYFTNKDGEDGIWKIPVQGGAETQVFQTPVHRDNFVVTADGIYYTPDRAADGSSSVRFWKMATGEVSEIVKIPNVVDLGLALSPDGKNILFAQIDYRGSNLMLVDGFR